MTAADAEAVFYAARHEARAGEAAVDAAVADLKARGVGPYGPGTEHMLGLYVARDAAGARCAAAYEVWRDEVWREASPARTSLTPAALRRARLLWGDALGVAPDDRHLGLPDVMAYLNGPGDAPTAVEALSDPARSTALAALAAARDEDHPLAKAQREARDRRYLADEASREARTYGWRGRME